MWDKQGVDNESVSDNESTRETERPKDTRATPGTPDGSDHPDTGEIGVPEPDALRVWQDYLNRQDQALTQVAHTLATKSGVGEPDQAGVDQMEYLAQLTTMTQPDLPLPIELHVQAQRVYERLIGAHIDVSDQLQAVAQQLDNLRARALTRDRGPVFLDTSG